MHRPVRTWVQQIDLHFLNVFENWHPRPLSAQYIFYIFLQLPQLNGNFCIKIEKNVLIGPGLRLCQGQSTVPDFQISRPETNSQKF